MIIRMGWQRYTALEGTLGCHSSQNWNALKDSTQQGTKQLNCLWLFPDFRRLEQSKQVNSMQYPTWSFCTLLPIARNLPLLSGGE